MLSWRPKKFVVARQNLFVVGALNFCRAPPSRFCREIWKFCRCDWITTDAHNCDPKCRQNLEPYWLWGALKAQQKQIWIYEKSLHPIRHKGWHISHKTSRATVFLSPDACERKPKIKLNCGSNLKMKYKWYRKTRTPSKATEPTATRLAILTLWIVLVGRWASCSPPHM